MTDLSRLMKQQREFQQLMGDLEQPEQRRVERIGQLQLLSLGQATHMMEELGYETHLPAYAPLWDNALYEWVDMFKYLMAQAVIAGWTAVDIERVFQEKSAIVKDRWERQRRELRPAAVFDLDGVIAHYTHAMTEREMAAGSLLRAQPVQSTVSLLSWLRALGYSVVIVTSRKVHRIRRLELDTERWLHNHRVEYDRLIFAYDKSEAVADMDVVFAVEDSKKHALDYAEAGHAVFFVQSADPDSRAPLHDNVVTVVADHELRAAVVEWVNAGEHALSGVWETGAGTPAMG